jgi:HEPN domain-containing protein
LSSRDHLDRARLLLKKSREDEDALETLIGDPDTADAIIGFHAQQAAEKALKAVLSARDIEYPWTHDLRFLMDLLDESDVQLPDGLDEVRALTPWAAEFRYGEVLAESLDRQATLKNARALRKWAEQLMSEVNCDDRENHEGQNT